MKKFLLILCLFTFVVSSCYSKPLSDIYPNQTIGVLCFGIDDIKSLLDNNGKETAKVNEEILNCLKNRLSIDIDKDIQHFGFYVLQVPTGIEIVGFLEGNFNIEDIITKIKAMNTSDKNLLSIGTQNINDKKVQTINTNKIRIIFNSNKTILICNEPTSKLIEQKNITFSTIPLPIKNMMERTDSFIYLGKQISLFLSALNLPIKGLETIDCVSAYYKNNTICIEAGFKNKQTADNMMNNIEKIKKDFYEMQNHTYERAKGSLRAPDFESKSLLDLIDKMLSSSKNKDYIDNLNISQKENSIILVQKLDTNLKLLLGAAGVGFVSSVAINYFGRAKNIAREKSCSANIRVLTGAVEMYNMDHSTMMTTLDMQTLVKEKYLKGVVEGVEPGCEYYSIGDLTQDGVIACKKHGKIPAMRR